MSQTRLDVLTTINVLVSDPNNQKWTKAQKVHFLNQALQDVVSSESIPYIRTAEIPLRDREYEYEFPEDMLEPLAMMFQDIEGSVVMSTGWKSMLNSSDYGYIGDPSDPAVFWRVNRDVSGHVTLRDIVSDNKFIFVPYYEAEDHTSATVTRSSALPSTAIEGEVWVDQFESENLIYACSESYQAGADQATITIDSGYLPGSTDLVMTYDVAGVKYVNVVLSRAGASGVSSVAITGDADDRSNPLTYTFNLYDDNNSNDVIIALNPTNLTVTGSDATSGTLVETSFELENPAASKWIQQVLHLRYVAIFPKLSNDEDELPLELPVLIREGDCLAYIAASKILMSMKGDERLLIMGREYRKEAKDVLDRCRKHRNGNMPPFDLSPA
jgi:hypothetical protein